MNLSSVFTFNRIFIVLFFFKLIALGVKASEVGITYEDIGRFVGLFGFLIIARVIYLVCTRKTS